MESDEVPNSLIFDIAIVAVGYERRCRWLFSNHSIEARLLLGLEFGYLADGSYAENVEFYKSRANVKIAQGLAKDSVERIANEILAITGKQQSVSILVDVSSMSRTMIANVVLGIQAIRHQHDVTISVAYLPSKFTKPLGPSPIRLASPMKAHLAGWAPRAERPVGVVCGLGYEEGLALGALQFLEPAKAWMFVPVGVQSQFDDAVRMANQHIGEIFDTSEFQYEITRPTVTRGKFEALLNSISQDFRVVVVPFGPKIFAWLAIATIVLFERREIGIWAFSSKDQERIVDRDAEGSIVWHSLSLARIANPSDSH